MMPTTSPNPWDLPAEFPQDQQTRSWTEVKESLKDDLTSPRGYFRLRYGLRNPRSGRGLGLRGVETKGVIKHYARALDAAYEFLHEKGWPSPQRKAAAPI